MSSSSAPHRRAVLVVDDLRTFAFDAVHARSSKEGIDILRSCVAQGQPLDEVWLDYHLGRGDNGGVVVAWLVANVDSARPLIGEVYVHSSDVSAARRLLAQLEAAGYRARRRLAGEPGAELR